MTTSAVDAQTLHEGSPLYEILHEVRIVQYLVEMLRTSRSGIEPPCVDTKAYEIAMNYVIDSIVGDLSHAMGDVLFVIFQTDDNISKKPSGECEE
jgi:hypothetical protein